jgi:hypothetical protein
MRAELVPAAVAARLAARVREELGDVARVVDETTQALARLPNEPPPDVVTLHGMGGLLHDFYTGIEKVFSLVAPELNGGLPAGESWHRELLHTMTLDLPGIRPPLVSTATEEALVEYLRFRHLYRNLYGFKLRWQRVRELAVETSALWVTIRSELEHFLAVLDNVAAATPPPDG